MISPDYPLASWFLIVSAVVFILVIALPLLFVPLTWARWFGWNLPEGSKDLTVYFGRCLGATALAIIIAVAHGIPDPKSHHLLFDLVSMTSGLMIGIHVWGLIRKTQPLSENLEIAVWVVVFVMSLWIRFSMLA
jgi:chromate transport protein ChrA